MTMDLNQKPPKMWHLEIW